MVQSEQRRMDESGDRRRLASMFCGKTGLLVLMTGYALLGALLFKALEGGPERQVPVTRVQKSREDCLRELWLITERLNVLYEKNWTRLVTEQLRRFERAVVESGKTDGLPNPGTPHWTFGGALLYSLTLLTTVGYARLSPRTSLGKIATVIYALIGVPLMLILLSAMGALLATGTKKVYSKLLCAGHRGQSTRCPNVGYHKAPCSPRPNGRSNNEDTASIQIASCHSTPNHKNCNTCDVLPKRALLATVRATHAARGRCRQTQVRQMLADNTMCPAHAHGSTNRRTNHMCTELEEPEEPDENDPMMCSHDTPSRVPLIYREEGASPPPPPPPVPATLVVAIFLAYVCAGAAALASASGWSFLDSVYFCFVALSTIGVGDKLPQSGDTHAQVQLLGCCLYIFLGLVVVAMCFSLVQEEVSSRCRHVASNIGLGRQ